MEKYKAYFDQGLEQAIAWLTSPAAWGQAAAIVLSIFLSILLSRFVVRFIQPYLATDDKDQSILAKARRFAKPFLPLIWPLIAFGLLTIAESVAASSLGQSEIVGTAKRLFIVVAAYTFITKVIYSPFLKTIGKYVLVPIAALYALGILDPVTTWLGATQVSLGSINFSLLALVRGAIAGSFLFWLGRWSNDQSSTYIRAQESLDVPKRELAAKAVELSILGTCFLLLMSIMGINLSALAVLGGAIGLGLGFGLQKIAANFISGIILLLEGQATVGDYVELDGGESGTIVRMMSRATILETFDGKWILVPNEDFITTRITNYSDAGSGNRYEADFSVSYDTDINLVPDIVEKAVAKHPGVLSKPEKPDCELRGFGDSGIDFSVEFWVEGIDDGKNKYTSDVLFIIWNALKENDIKIPYPHRVVEIKGALPK